MIKKNPIWLSLLAAFVMLSAFVALPANATASAPQAAPTAQQVPCRSFPETGQVVGGRFLEYWRDHGGLAQQGYPISGEFVERSAADGQEYTVQYFERAVLEYHPANQPPNDVLLSLLGAFTYQQRYPGGAPGQQQNRSGGARYFAETDHWVGGGFLEYWDSHGGLAQQGYPVSDEFDEVSSLNGQSYRVQYFQRAVLEYHPENQPPNTILLSQLGTFRLRNLYAAGTPTDGQLTLDCVPDADADGITDNADRCPDQPETYNKVFDTDGCPDSFKDLVDLTAADLNRYWGKVFVASDLQYTPPVDVVPYSEPIRTACGRAVLQNAFYCSNAHAIYYDINFLQDQLNSDGDFAPVVIIAHEWGHLVQDNLGILNAGYATIYLEAQADCLAGSWAKDVSENPGKDALVSLDQGDLDEGAVALFKAGDDDNTPWFNPQAHGQPQQRVDAFELGVSGGVEACFSNQ